MPVHPGCDMASFHVSWEAKANFQLITLARPVTVNLHVISALANYLFRSCHLCLVCEYCRCDGSKGGCANMVKQKAKYVADSADLWGFSWRL